MSKRLPHMLSFRNSLVSGITSRSLIHFEFFVCVHGISGSVSFLCTLLYSFPSTNLKDSTFPIVHSCHLCHRLTILVWFYFWTIMFHWFICLSLCEYHTVLISIALQHFLNLGLWYFQLCSISGLLCLSQVFCVSIKL